jgi:hypothetical protein
MLLAGMMAAVSGATSASAQPAVNLTGTWHCMQACSAGFEGRPAFITQNGWTINLVTEAGVSAQAWSDWFAPTTRIWIEALRQGAVYSHDGMIIQFDNGTVWRRIVEPTPEVITYCARRYRSYEPGSQTFLGTDGIRHPCPAT